MADFRFRFASRLAAPPSAVWAHMTTMEGVNAELRPLVRMTYPRGRGDLEDNLVLGRPLFRSWILLFGLVPIDYDDITLREYEPERGFAEDSPMGTMRVWRHRRTLRPDPQGCQVVDELRCRPRLPLSGPFLVAAFIVAFKLRHRNLRRIFGQPADRGRDAAV